MLGLGVSDGVYMWRNQGIDAGVFSRSLMLSAKNAIEYGQTDVLNGDALSAKSAAASSTFVPASGYCMASVSDSRTALRLAHRLLPRIEHLLLP